MDPERDEVSITRPEEDTTGDPTEALKTSSDSTKPSSGRRGCKRRMATAVTSTNSGDPRSGTEGPVRVLRPRRAGAGKTSVNKANNSKSKKNPKSLRRGRGRPAASRKKNTSAKPSTIKKSTSKKANKQTVRQKISKPRKGKGRPAIQPSSTTPATECKSKAKMKVASLHGQITGAFKGSNDKEKSKRATKLQQKEVKKEESEKEEDGSNLNKKESAKVAVEIENREDDDTEPFRKRGRQQKDDKAPRLPKRRKKPPVQYVRCEIEGCGTILAHPRYLKHHIKYQHLLKKKYVCEYPSCGRLFRLQKQLLRHAKHHTDQRDYICEYCARAFKSSHNLVVHRMIHTGEKPIQCEICGFTCRQKSSLNWHMKKHDVQASYQFSCSICGKKFEKKDSVVAHKAKSHPEVLIAEALAANGGSVISSPITNPETVPALTQPTQPDQPPVSQKSQGDASDTLTPLQQVVLPLNPQTHVDASQGQFPQLPNNHVVQVAHQQQAPTLLPLTAASPAHPSNTSHPQIIQFSSLPVSTVSSMSTADPQSTLLTLNSVTMLASTASLTSQQAVQWEREAEDVQLPGEGELWNRVVVGGCNPDEGEMMWEGNSERRKEDEGIVWEREGERQILLQCAEVHGDGLI